MLTYADEEILRGPSASQVADAFDLANAVKTTTQAPARPHVHVPLTCLHEAEGPAAVRMAALEREAKGCRRYPIAAGHKSKWMLHGCYASVFEDVGRPLRCYEASSTFVQSGSTRIWHLRGHWSFLWARIVKGTFHNQPRPELESHKGHRFVLVSAYRHGPRPRRSQVRC